MFSVINAATLTPRLRTSQVKAGWSMPSSTRTKLASASDPVTKRMCSDTVRA